MTTDELRAKFEAHFSQPPYEWNFTLLHDGSGWPGSYDKYYVQCAWEAWQGAHASRDAEVEALRKRIDDAPVYYIPTEKPTDEAGWIQVIGSVKAINNMRGKHVRLVIDAAMREGE